MWTVLDCCHLEVNLKEKCIFMLPVLPKGVKKIIWTFLNEDFSIPPQCHRHRWCTLSFKYFRECFEKILNGPNVMLMGLGETDSWKTNQRSNISWDCPFKFTSILFFLCKNPLINNRLTGGTRLLGNYSKGPWDGSILSHSEPVFRNVYIAWRSSTTNRVSYRAVSAGIFNQSMGARNRVGVGLSYQPARLHRLAEFIPWSRFLGSINV
jgi:hypothetical protein